MLLISARYVVFVITRGSTTATFPETVFELRLQVELLDDFADEVLSLEPLVDQEWLKSARFCKAYGNRVLNLPVDVNFAESIG